MTEASEQQYRHRRGRKLAIEHLRQIGNRRPPSPSALDGALLQRADPQRRACFLREHILIHTHIPKTGGSSFSAGLAGIVGGVDFYDLRLKKTTPLSELGDAGLDTVRGISSHTGYGFHVLFDRVPLYFAVVRDPVERAVSTYRFLQNRPNQPEARFAIGYSFEESWRLMSAKARRNNLQSRLLVSPLDDQPVEEDRVRERLEKDYFLVIPTEKITQTIKRLREAFGVFRTPHPPVNVSRHAEVRPDPGLAEEIREANAIDARLHDHVASTYARNIDRACRVIASHCLQRAEDG